jgi:hypothetical protein
LRQGDWKQASCGLIEEKIFQEMISLLPGLRLVRPLCRQLLLDGIEQGLVDDRRLFARQYLTSVLISPTKKRLRRS